MAKLKNLKAKVETHPTYKVPRRIYELDVKASSAEPRKVAESLLKKIARDLQIKADLSQLKFDRVKSNILGTQVLFQQYHDLRPISGAWIRVDIDQNGKVYNILNDLVPEKVLAQADRTTKKAKTAKAAARGESAELSAEQAKERTLEVTGSPSRTPHQVLECESVNYPYKGLPIPAWKVIVKSSVPAGEWKVYLDAVSGEVLEQINLLRRQDGKGRVFDPNPVATLNDTTLEDNSLIPDAAYSEVTLRDLENSGHLDGPFVSTRTTSNRVKRTDLQFLFRRDNRAFKEVMAYYHIDRVQRYIQELGFDSVLNKAIEVNVDGIPDDSSFYSPSSKSLTFGRGGVDDAEDAEIVLHEYGHAIQDNIVPGFGPSGEARAMGEGFGDYLAASFFAESKPERLKPCIGTWDAVAYSGDEPPNLRRLDSNKKYPRDMTGEEHNDGEIWSACLWEIRAAIGGRVADRIVFAHHFQLSRTASFEDAANALITVDKVLNEGRNEATIRDVFVRRGIFPNAKRKNRRAGVPFKETTPHDKRRGR